MSALSKYKAYPEYKDSGVEWLGEIPNNWINTSIKYGYNVTLGKMLQKEKQQGNDLLKPYLKAQNIQPFGLNLENVEKMWFSHEERKRLSLQAGDVLVSEGGDVGRSAIWQNELDECYIQNALNRVRSENNNTKYFLYWISFLKETDYINILCNKATIAHYTAEKLKDSPLLLPSIQEQTKIAQFLDHETAKIDQLIEKQQTLIELLKEKRQAVISHAVTKGLNPNIKMKDSGVEWLGEVPEHWQLLKATYLGKLFGSETILESDIKEEGSIPFLKVSNLSLNSFALESKSFFIGSNKINSVSPKNNYIVFPKRGAAIFTNKVNIIREDSLLDPNLMGWQINQNAIPEYIAFLLKLRRLDDIADISTVPQINNKHIEPQKFPIPPILEQREIIDFLDTQISKFDLLTQKAEEQIELMKERKTALISAAVTGKIDVRDWQPEQ